MDFIDARKKDIMFIARFNIKIISFQSVRGIIIGGDDSDGDGINYNFPDGDPDNNSEDNNKSPRCLIGIGGKDR